MAIANYFYNSTLRKYVALFGTYFNQLKIQRVDNNNVLNPNYNPSSQDLINGVNLSVSVANGTNCPTVSETINVIFEENVSVSAGDDGIICENDTFQITNANTTALNFTWSSSGDGTFINDTTLSPIYTPGPSDINSGILTRRDKFLKILKSRREIAGVSLSNP